MIELLIDNMAPIMFVSLVLCLLLGYPVAFSLSAVGLGFAWLGIELGLFGENFLRALPERVFGTMATETLLAIPFFTFMGLVLQRSGMAEDLIDTIAQLFGPVRGGVAYAVIFVGTLLAATTGIVAASVISLSLIALPIMMRYKYDKYLATGVIMASGTLTQIVPPSIILIVLADQFGVSVGGVYQAALLPALCLIVLYLGYVFGLTWLRPDTAPALPPEARRLKEDDGSLGLLSLAAILLSMTALGFAAARLLEAANPNLTPSNRGIYGAVLGIAAGYLTALANRWLGFGLLSRMAEAVIIVLVPPLTLIFLVLGTIFLGIATPTEGGAMGAAGALIMALSRRQLSLSMLSQAIDATARLSTFVMFILIGSRVFALTFYGLDGHLWVEHLLLSLPGGMIGFLIVVNLMVFLLGFFLDFFEIAFIIVPLLASAAQILNIDLVWLAVMLAINLKASYLTPPFGFALFFMRSATPDKPYVDTVTGRRIDGIRTTELYRAAMFFVAIQMVMIGILIMFPELVMHYKGSGPLIDQANIRIEIPESLEFDLDVPEFKFD